MPPAATSGPSITPGGVVDLAAYRDRRAWHAALDRLDDRGLVRLLDAATAGPTEAARHERRPARPGARLRRHRLAGVPVPAGSGHLPGRPGQVRVQGAGHAQRVAWTPPPTQTDPRWWAGWPGANVAIATGAPGPDVLDIDVKPAGSGYAGPEQAHPRRGAHRRQRPGPHTPRRRPRLLRRHQPALRPPAPPSPRLQGAPAGMCSPRRASIHGRPYQLLDHRPGTAALDWAAVKRVLDPPRRPCSRPAHGRAANCRRVSSGHSPPTPRTGRRPCTGWSAPASAPAWTRTAIHQLAGNYQPALEKYGAAAGRRG